MKINSIKNPIKELLESDFILITHDDLDGLGCRWAVEQYLSNMHVTKIVSYPSEVDNLEIDDSRAVLITDLAVETDIYDQLRNAGIRFLVIDHHPYTVKLAEEHPEEYPENFLAIGKNYKKYVKDGVCTKSATYLLMDTILEDSICINCRIGSNLPHNALNLVIAEAISMQDQGIVDSEFLLDITPRSYEGTTLDLVIDGINQFITQRALSAAEGSTHSMKVAIAKEERFNEAVRSLGTFLMIATKCVEMQYQISPGGNPDKSRSRRYTEIIKMLNRVAYPTFDTNGEARIEARPEHQVLCSILQREYRNMINGKKVILHSNTSRDRCMALCLNEYPLAFTLLSVTYFADPNIPDPDKADVIVVRTKKGDKITYSFRTGEQSKVTARAIAEYGGGGGHRNAAGCNNQDAVVTYDRIFDYMDTYSTPAITTDCVDEFKKYL